MEINRNVVETAWLDGMNAGQAKGKEEGKMEGKIEIACHLLPIMDDVAIAQITGLDVNAIRQLRLTD